MLKINRQENQSSYLKTERFGIPDSRLSEKSDFRNFIYLGEGQELR